MSDAPPQASDSASANGKPSPNNAENLREMNEILEERLIDAEYKIWKKNTPYLYNFVMTHSLEWPSLTCQWLPTVKSVGGSASAGASSPTVMEHSMLLGTHTTGEQNYLMMASVNLPENDMVVNDTNEDDDEPNNKKRQKKDSTHMKSSAEDDSNTDNNNNDNNDRVTYTASNYDEEKGEVGGFGTLHGSTHVGKIEIKMKIKHEGEVNRARYMPQNHFVIASRGPSPQIYIWDLSKHSSFPDEGSAPAPQGVCVGHSEEGYGLCWSPHQEGLLITGSGDTNVCLWDVKNAYSMGSQTGTQFNPVGTFVGHKDFVEDVDWHHRDVNLIGSVSDDKSIRIWDIRKKNEGSAYCVENAHESDINSIAFNNVNEYLFATGSADKTIALWDMRNLSSRIQTLKGHTDQVFNLQWAPFNESILASCSSDRRVAIWDLSLIGKEQTPEDAEDGPPELLFLHGGHTSKVSDFSWNINDEWTMVSVSEDNVVQVWNMAEEIYEDEDVEDEDALGDDELE